MVTKYKDLKYGDEFWFRGERYGKIIIDGVRNAVRCKDGKFICVKEDEKVEKV